MLRYPARGKSSAAALGWQGSVGRAPPYRPRLTGRSGARGSVRGLVGRPIAPRLASTYHPLVVLRSEPGLLLVFVCLALAACERSVARPSGGDVLVLGLEAEPAFVRGSTPFSLVFELLGPAGAEVSYSVGNDRFGCTPSIRTDGRAACAHPGLDRARFGEGPVPIRVEARDDEGRVSASEASVTLDVTCPRAISARITPSIAEPGTVVVVEVEASEALDGPPLISRLGRDWGVASFDGDRWRLERRLGPADPAQPAPVRVVLVDRAGNRNLDCGLDIDLELAVDGRRPVIDPTRVLLERGAPGSPAVITATAGAFSDDVGVREIRVLDASGRTLLGTLSPTPEGGLEPTSLGQETQTRIQLEAVDAFGRSSGPQPITERWRLSLGTGSFPGAALRTGVRLRPAPPGSRSMVNRTVDGAPDIARADARTLLVRARVGFEKVGDLPSFYENTFFSFVGYEPVTETILVVGGLKGEDANLFAAYTEEVLALTWDERAGSYVAERLEPLSFEDDSIPDPGYGWNLAFDGEGCGVLYGGRVRFEPTDIATTFELYEICAEPGGFRWSRVEVPAQIGDTRLARRSPIVWDPLNRRYVAIGGAFDAGALAVVVRPYAPAIEDRVRLIAPLPSAFGRTRSDGYLFFDPRLGGVSTGLGGVSPRGSAEESIQWTYADGVWRTSPAPFDLWRFRYNLGFAFDEAREQLTLWGGREFLGSFTIPDPLVGDVWYMTGTATSGPEGWRRTEVEVPLLRDYPSLVYDRAREVVVVLGGIRFEESSLRPVPPEVYQLVSQPAFPYVQAEIELGTERPKGIEGIDLVLRASGAGDADGEGPADDPGAGVTLLLWDWEAERWREVGATTGGDGGLEWVEVQVSDRPERFVASDGRLAISLRSTAPATEARAARLEVDLLDGEVRLRPGVRLP